MSVTNSPPSVAVEDEISVDIEVAPHATLRMRHRELAQGVMFSLGIYVVSRLLVALTMWMGTALLRTRSFSEALLAWDSGWYYGVVRQGYPHVAYVPGDAASAANTIAFFPVFPMVTRLVQNVFDVSTIQAGVAVSLVSGAGAVCMLWTLARHFTNAATANRTVVLYSLFPGSLAAMLLMSEGIMLTFAIASLLALAKKHWVTAGLCAAVATATRPNALVLVACCAWACAVALFKYRDWRSLAAPLLAPLGMLAYFAFLWHHTGDFLAWFTVENKGWAYGDLGHFFVFRAFSPFFDNPLADLNASASIMGLLLAAAGFVMLAWWRKPPVTLVLFALGVCAFAFFTGGWASKIRYVWVVFPFAIAWARWAHTDLRFAALVSISAVSLALYTLLETFTAYSIF